MLRSARHPRHRPLSDPYPAFCHRQRHVKTFAVRMWALLAAMLWACTAFAETYRLPLFVHETISGQTGLLRIHNESDVSGSVSIYAIDDAGTKSGPATLELAAGVAVEFEASELESGDADHVLTGGLGILQGDVRLEILTELTVAVLAYLRTDDGTLAVLHDEVSARTTESGGYEYRVPVFNPAHSMAQASRLRLINPSGNAAMVSIQGRDDAGTAAIGGTLSLMLSAGGARTLTAQQLEAGGAGLTGQLGAGMGRWRLLVSSDQAIEVVNLVSSSTGRLDNLSSSGRDGLAPGEHAVFGQRFVEGVIETRSGDRQGMLSIHAGDMFTETEESGATGEADTRSGNYTYRRAGPHAGKLTLNYMVGDLCVANLYFTSRTSGWYASRCDSADNPQGDWRGGSWALAGAEVPPVTPIPPIPDVSAPRFPAASELADQNYTLGAAISALVLPAASGGNATLTYSLAPAVPGLAFDPATRRLSGAPTEAGVQAMTYRVTDMDGDTDTLRFLIIVREGASDDCLLGLLVRPGESCTYPGTSSAFSVNEDGSGQFLIITSTRAINLPNRTYQGQLYDFHASHRGDGVWRVDRLRGVEAPPPDTTPRFPDSNLPGNQAFMAGRAFEALTLPAATRGEGMLTYSLIPSVPGLRFDPATRRLSGTPTEGGVHFMTYMVRDEDGDTDSFSFTIIVEEAPNLPDLVVESLFVSDNTLNIGQSFRLSAGVRNQGRTESAGTTLRYYRSSDMTISTSDTEVGTESLGALSASGTSNQSISLTAPSSAGTYYYGACVEAVADESDTGNNCSTGVRVTVTEAPEAPDLVVESPSVSQSSLTPSQNFTFSATVRNQGAAQSATTTLRYYRSSNPTITASDGLIGTDSVATLAVSGTSFESIRVAGPSSAGTYYYGACVETVSGESDTNNNCSTAVRVTVTTPGPVRQGPDLVVDSASIDDPTPETGEPLTLSVRVRNQGTEQSAGTTLRYYRSSDMTITASDTEVGSDSLGLLSASGTSNEDISFAAPSSAAIYYYGACVEAVSGESDSTNNCSTAVRVTVTTPNLIRRGPDLVVDSASIDDPSPEAGEPLTLSVRVRNQGTAQSAGTTLRYYRSSDMTITTSDTLFGNSSLGPLSASDTLNKDISFAAPSSAGSHYYGACVEALANELDTTNNCSPSVEVSVKARQIVSDGFDIDIDYAGGPPPARFKTVFEQSVAFWERAITGDQSDVDFSADPRSNPCTDGEFDGFIDDLRVRVEFEDVDGLSGEVASAGVCTLRAGSGTPVLAVITFDSTDAESLSTTTLRAVSVHELAHALGFGVLWGGVQNPSLRHGEPVDPPPDTYWAGSQAVAAFNAAGGTNYQGGKVPVENEFGGRGSQDRHWRYSKMAGEIMTYNLSGTKVSAVTIQSMADLGYLVDAGAADDFTVSASAFRAASAITDKPQPRCEVELTDFDFVGEPVSVGSR